MCELFCEECQAPYNECRDECPCHECQQIREAEKDREFDEKIALGYFV